MLLLRARTTAAASVASHQRRTFARKAKAAAAPLIEDLVMDPQVEAAAVAEEKKAAPVKKPVEDAVVEEKEAAKKKAAPVKKVVEDTKKKELIQQQKDALAIALAKIEKQFGKGTVAQLGSSSTLYDPEKVVSTGVLGLDDAIGIGGLPLGRIVEIFGPEASGKTCKLALSIIAEAQKLGGKSMFVDAEHALDPELAKVMGVNLDDLYVTQPDSGEDALEIVDNVVRSGAMTVIVVDSVSALVPRSEIEGEMGDEKIGVQARLMSRALRKLTPTVSKSNTVLIFINQIRHKIGVMFGSPETTSGGQALKFYSSVRLDVRKSNVVKNASGEVTGTTHKVKVVKNKVGPPFRVVEFSMRFGQGIDRTNELLEVGIVHEIIETRGAYYYVNHPDFLSPEGTKLMIGQGREKTIDNLNKDTDLRDRLTAAIKAKSKSAAKSPKVLSPDEESLEDDMTFKDDEILSFEEELIK